jgi:hypothetical protein
MILAAVWERIPSDQVEFWQVPIILSLVPVHACQVSPFFCGLGQDNRADFNLQNLQQAFVDLNHSHLRNVSIVRRRVVSFCSSI